MQHACLEHEIQKEHIVWVQMDRIVAACICYVQLERVVHPLGGDTLHGDASWFSFLGLLWKSSTLHGITGFIVICAGTLWYVCSSFVHHLHCVSA